MIKKKEFVEPELIKHEEKLDEVTMGGAPPMGSPGAFNQQVAFGQ